MVETVIPRLGLWRCYEAKGTQKDINLELFKNGKEAVLKIIENAKEVPITDVVDLADIEDYDITKAEGIHTNIKGMDKFLGKFYFGCVSMITGINGSGKSTFINQTLVAEAIEQGYKTFIFSGELTKQALKSWIDFPIAGVKHIEIIERGKFQPKGYRIKKEIKEKINTWYQGKVHVYDKEFNIVAGEILLKMEELARKYGVKNFILDNLMMINCGEYNKYNDYEAQSIFVLKLCEFARNFNVVIHLITHPSKIDTIRRLTKMDISGMMKLTNIVHYVIAIHRVTQKEKDGVASKRGDILTTPIKYDALIDILKNRPMGHQDKTIGCYFDIASKRFYGDSDDINRQYS
jgi:twinkle protein